MSKVIDKLNKEEKNILENITNINDVEFGAYNIRHNGKLYSKKVTENINIVGKTDSEGIDIIVESNCQNENVYIPVIISSGGINDLVYNDFYIKENAKVTIYAGCGINNCSHDSSEHSGIHRFHVGKNATVKYIENHYGHGTGEKILNPVTEVYLEKNSKLEMYTTQIEGVNSTIRKTSGNISDDATLIVRENIKTHDKQYAKTIFDVNLDGENSSCHLVSRAVALNDSLQEFVSKLTGNKKSYAHSECDAILEDNGKVIAKPEVIANCPDATLIHEATIGKIAGEQLIKLMTLGLTEKEAESVIINGFLK